MKIRRIIQALRTSRVLALGLLGAAISAPAPASAQTVAVVQRLPEATAAQLRRDVKQAREADARPFIVTTDIVRNAHAADQLARARKAPIALQLARLGPPGLLPMLEILAEGPPKTMTEGVQEIRRDLIEAVGLLRQPRSLAVLGAILDDPTEEEETTTIAAEAVARLGTDEAATRVLRALDAATHPVRARAILAGIGECRRLRVADALAARLRSASDPATARITARSLGRAGNAWAWKTIADRSEESRVRESAARALVEAFVRQNGEARTAADNALMVVDDPHTPALIADAKRGASAETVKALDALAARFANNPAR